MIKLRPLIDSIMPRKTIKRYVLIEHIGRTERSVSDEFRLTLHEQAPLSGFDPVWRTDSEPYQLFQGIIPVVSRSLQREAEKQWEEGRVQILFDFHYDWLLKTAAGFVGPSTLRTYARKDVEELTTKHCLSYFMRVEN